MCHRNIVDKKLINERATFPFESIDLPPNDRHSIASNGSGPASHDFLPSESNLNTAIHHDDDGFSDSGKFDDFKGTVASDFEFLWDFMVFKTSIKMTIG